MSLISVVIVSWTTPVIDLAWQIDWREHQLTLDHELNRLIREHEATAVIHTGDFGFLTADSLDRMGDR